MRKIQLFGIALVALCAFSSFTAVSAFAALEFEPAKWLKNGVAITTTESANTEGELLFLNLLNGAELLCSGLFEGTVGANGVDEVTAVFALGATSPTLELDEKGENGILCTALKTCEKPAAGEDTEIWPVNLPFKTQLDLDKQEPTLFFDLAIGNGLGAGKEFPAYLILCLVFLVNVEELCESLIGTFGEVSNAATDVEPLGPLVPEGTCNGNAEDGEIENNVNNVALISLLNGGTLAVSE